MITAAGVERFTHEATISNRSLGRWGAETAEAPCGGLSGRAPLLNAGDEGDHAALDALLAGVDDGGAARALRTVTFVHIPATSAGQLITDF